jgi:hydrogenase nickel incorporation protein HypA/HybF
MHELAIAQALLDIAEAAARGRRVTVVEVRVGHLRQVVPDALTFSFELVAHGTVVEGAQLVLEEVPPAGRCRSCAAEGALDALPLRCRSCGSWDVEVTRGEELVVDTIEIEEETVMSGSAAGHER